MHWIARQIFKLLGWRVIGTVPSDIEKAVLVIAPHTSNWDFFYWKMAGFIDNTPVRFAIKKEVMFFPLGPILRWMGAIPIDRGKRFSRKQSMVDQMAALFRQNDRLLIAIAPEGTRSFVKRWKTGFYRLALQAQVPIILCDIDYEKKRVGLGKLFRITGNQEADIATMIDYYRDKKGKYPKQSIGIARDAVAKSKK